MDRNAIVLVQRSWACVQPNARTAAVVFYARLFKLDTALPALFRGDMLEQGEKLMRMIDAAVRLLEDPSRLVQALQGLGERHAAYGVETMHYPLVGTALLGTLHETLGEAFDPPTRAAWTTVYQFIADTMTSAAQALDAAGQAGGCDHPTAPAHDARAHPIDPHHAEPI
ncbi:MAG: globin family protein [Ideonella sp.]